VIFQRDWIFVISPYVKMWYYKGHCDFSSMIAISAVLLLSISVVTQYKLLYFLFLSLGFLLFWSDVGSVWLWVMLLHKWSGWYFELVNNSQSSESWSVWLELAAVGRDGCGKTWVHGSIDWGAHLVHAGRGSRIGVSHGLCPKMIQASYLNHSDKS